MWRGRVTVELSIVVAMALGIGASGAASASPDAPVLPERFAPYYSGPPCSHWQADRTFSQFEVNLATHTATLEGVLVARDDGAAALRLSDGREIRLVSNASRVDWLLTLPYVGSEVEVLGRSILSSDCTVSRDSVYIEALYPAFLFRESIEPALDLRHRVELAALRHAVGDYRELLGDGRRGRQSGVVARLVDELFADAVAESPDLWRVRIVGPEDPPDAPAVDLVLSGSDGGAGLFGHIAVGVDGQVFNVYPKGSERGAPVAVPLGEYLFSAKRGQALRRPSWILRVQGLPDETVTRIRDTIQQQVENIDNGERPYHPTRNNCVTACLRSLEPAGIKVSRLRYFTRRFPRPVFSKVLNELPRLVDAAGPDGMRVELWFVPQVGIRPLTGRAPNRPLWDRTNLD